MSSAVEIPRHLPLPSAGGSSCDSNDVREFGFPKNPTSSKPPHTLRGGEGGFQMQRMQQILIAIIFILTSEKMKILTHGWFQGQLNISWFLQFHLLPIQRIHLTCFELSKKRGNVAGFQHLNDSVQF